MRTYRLAALTLLTVATACSDGTGPKAGDMDAQRVQQGIAVVERVAASKILASLHAVGRAADDVGAAQSSMSWSPGLESAVRTLSNAAVSSGTALIPVMRSSVLGTTFIYDPAARKYVPDPARKDAPSNGVRFVLYEVDPNEDPLAGKEIGHADLTDERRSSSSTAGVRLQVVTGGVTRLTYSFDITGSLQSAQMDVAGYITDGSDRLDFTIKTSQQLFARGGPATLEARLYVPQEDFEVRAKVSGVAGEEGGDGSVDLTIRSRYDDILVDAETNGGVLDASFRFNGELFATASGDPKAPILRSSDGRELTDEEMQVVGAIVGMADGIFSFVSDLLEPAGVLLLIALGIGA